MLASIFNFLVISFKNVVFLLLESNKVIFIVGYTIFKTKPGNPAPVPISSIFILSFIKLVFTNVSES